MSSPVGKALCIVAGVLTTLNGLINVFHNVLTPWCTISEAQSCVGPALKWNSGDVGFTADSNADGWRSVLTTDLNTMLDIWSPVLFGFALLATASVRLRSSSFIIGSISYSWTRMGAFLLLAALFGSFGYTGNFGIITGLINSITSFYCIFCHFAGFVGGTMPCVNESGEKSGTPLFDRIMSRKPGKFGTGVQANRMQAEKERQAKVSEENSLRLKKLEV
ncbi:hypothetical protein TrLO_g6675 [Triparma laevis f. longispina]|uniref:Uncharacterized protein n=1 Tax=Triparma laevis f. longispina TaxID=1714387 RepID=A0A9W7B5C6_9STRA|nr:hypothetical protein TrLO_g6675 [Triparma laevis f. longispina]